MIRPLKCASWRMQERCVLSTFLLLSFSFPWMGWSDQKVVDWSAVEDQEVPRHLLDLPAEDGGPFPASIPDTAMRLMARESGTVSWSGGPEGAAR